MNHRPPRPVEIKLLCLAFVVWSALSVAVNVPRWWTVSPSGTVEYNFVFDFGSFAFLAAIGLWRYSPTGRKWALVFTWYWLIGSALLFLQLFPTQHISVTPAGDFLANVPRGFLRVFVVPFFLVQFWQRRTLNRPEIKAFYSRPPPLPIPRT